MSASILLVALNIETNTAIESEENRETPCEGEEKDAPSWTGYIQEGNSARIDP